MEQYDQAANNGNNSFANDGYDLSIYENPDLSAFRPGPFLYAYDKKSKQGQVFDFDPTTIVFGPLERRGNNSSSIVRMQIKNPITGALDAITLQNPPMTTIFGLSTMDKFDGPESGAGVGNQQGRVAGKQMYQRQGWKVDLSFRDILQLKYNRDNASPELQLLEQFFHSLFVLDQLVVKKAKESVTSWFAGSRALERNPDLIDGLYKSLTATRFSKKKQKYFPPALRIKAGKTHGAFNFKVFDKDMNALNPNDIQPDTILTALIEVSGIWFVENSFGIGLRLLQTEVSKPEVIDTYCIARVMPMAGKRLREDSHESKENTGNQAPQAKRQCLPAPPQAPTAFQLPPAASLADAPVVQLPTGTFRLTGMK